MKKLLYLLAFLCIGPVSFGADVVTTTPDVTVSRLNKNTLVLETWDNTTMYLLEGRDRAMLIDTGTKCEALDSIVGELTDKPLYVVLTHNHPDHAGCVSYFDEIYMHPADTVLNFRGLDRYEGRVNYLSEGQKFDLGGRTVEVSEMPAHTPGSVIFLDKDAGDAFTGDAFGSGEAWLQCLPLSPMKDYRKSIDKMLSIMERDGISRLYVGHYPYQKAPVGKEYLERMAVLADRLIAGDLASSTGSPIRSATMGSSPRRVSDGMCAIVFDGGAVASESRGAWGASRVVTDTVHSEILGDDRLVNVYLPAGFDLCPERTYPVLYLLHGLDGDNADWTSRGHLKDVMDQLTASGEVVDMVIVSPDAGGLVAEDKWNGYFNMPGWKYEDFFFEEMMPRIETLYRAGGDKSRRAVAGLSMGGGGSTSYAQRHPADFGAVYAMSALMDLPDGNSVLTDLDGDSKMACLNRSVRANSCIGFVDTADAETRDSLRSVDWFVDCGDDDFLFDRNVEFVMAMHRAGVPVQFRVRDGGHTWEYWHSALYEALPFVSRYFLRQQ